MTSPLQPYLVERIRRHGPMPFAAYMQMALYHPQHGYYAGGGIRTGWNGHFVTSAELDPGFGRLWTTAFEEIWELAGRPARFDLIEIGPGEGGFAQAVLEAATGDFAHALRLRLIERTPDNEARQRELLKPFSNVTWHRSLAEAPRGEAGCLFANEVLDNLPVHLVESHGAEIYEVCVEADEERLIPTLRPPSNPELSNFLKRCGVVLADGSRFEIALAAESLVAHASSRFERGAWIFVDYGLEAQELAERPQGSLVCYSAGGPDDLPLVDPGTKDVTVHANWTSLRAALRSVGQEVQGPLSQRSVLKRLGLDDLHQDLKDLHAEAISSRRGAAALRALSRRQALGALADPQGLGGLGVMVGTRGVARPSFV